MRPSFHRRLPQSSLDTVAVDQAYEMAYLSDAPLPVMPRKPIDMVSYDVKAYPSNLLSDD